MLLVASQSSLRKGRGARHFPLPSLPPPPVLFRLQNCAVERTGGRYTDGPSFALLALFDDGGGGARRRRSSSAEVKSAALRRDPLGDGGRAELL